MIPMKKEEVEEMLKYFEERFGISKDIFNDYDFYKTTKKIWIARKELKNANLSRIKFESIGMHFATIDKKRKRFKISTDASQLFGKFANKNIVLIPEEKLINTLRGFDLINFDCDAEDGYVLLKYKEHILGVGLKNGNFIKNMIPKERRLKI